MEEVAMELVVGVFRNDVGLKNSFSIFEFVVGNEGGEEGDERKERQGG